MILRLDRTVVMNDYLAFGLGHSLISYLGFGVITVVNLVPYRGIEVKTHAGVVIDMSNRIGAGGDRLGFCGLDQPAVDLADFTGNDARQIIFDIEDINDPDLALDQIDVQIAAKGFAIDHDQSFVSGYRDRKFFIGRDHNAFFVFVLDPAADRNVLNIGEQGDPYLPFAGGSVEILNATQAADDQRKHKQDADIIDRRSAILTIRGRTMIVAVHLSTAPAIFNFDNLRSMF